MLVRLHLLLAELVLSTGGPCQISQDVADCCRGLHTAALPIEAFPKCRVISVAYMESNLKVNSKRQHKENLVIGNRPRI